MNLGTAQKVIIILFSILLLVIFVMVIWTFSSAQKETNWPPTSQTCPDYWFEGTTAGFCTGKCGTGNKSIDFNGISSCDKYKWTKNDPSLSLEKCSNIQWDGINYGYGQYNPCNENYHPQTI